MAQTDALKLSRKTSKQTTKDFAKSVKSFVKTMTKGGRSGLAFVVGYMDASAGRASTGHGIPDSNILDYSNGWLAASKKEPTKRKSKPGRL
jgi:hypothetical protein